jgi:hypothetical protein
LVFISHKHSDSLIADEVRQWIYKWGRREVEVYQSSAPDARGPEIARSLSGELSKALWRAGAVILIYTTEEQDWSWCMYECGVATIPETPDTRVVVFQCSMDAPKVFADKVRVDARNVKDIKKFVISFLTDPEFFPDLGKAVAPGLRPEHIEVETAASELSTALLKVLPTTPVSEWGAQARFRLQLPDIVADRLAGGQMATADQQNALEHASIIDMNQQASRVFAIAELPPGANLGWLSNRWSAAYPGVPNEWADDILSQVREAVKGGTPALRWSYVREVGGTDRHVAVLTSVRRVPALKSVQFDVVLLPYDRSIATPVVERMIKREEMEFVNIDETPPDQVKLLWLTNQFDQHHLNRIPMLDHDGRIRLIVHRSVINNYITRRLNATFDGVKDLTLAQLLADEPSFKRLFETSFDIVSRDARLSDVRARMTANPDCYDVFVTPTGLSSEPIVGWLTDVIIAQSLAFD